MTESCVAEDSVCAAEDSVYAAEVSMCAAEVSDGCPNIQGNSVLRVKNKHNF